MSKSNTSKRCNLWWCWRKSAGYLELGFPGTDYYERVPYCAKHGKTVQEIIDDGDYTIPYKPNPTPEHKVIGDNRE